MSKHFVREAYALLVIVCIIALAWLGADMLMVKVASLVH
jgi:hypothetical protein